jgi:hypothetical protein
MTSKVTDQSRAIGRVRSRHEEGPPPVRAARAVRDKRVRSTVDLSPADHREFVRWCADATDLGAACVTGQDVLTVLLRLMLADTTIAERVKTQLAQQA